MTAPPDPAGMPASAGGGHGRWMATEQTSLPAPIGMTFWDWLHRLGPGWPAQRGWYALGLFIQTAAILWMIATFPALRSDEFFKAIATAIVVTGWIGFAVGLRDPAKDREQIAALITRLPFADPAPRTEHP